MKVKKAKKKSPVVKKLFPKAVKDIRLDQFRLGNLIDCDGKIIMVLGIQQDGFTGLPIANQVGGDLNIGNSKPLAITTELAELLGFKKGVDFLTGNDQWQLDFADSKDVFTLDFDDNDNCVFHLFKHLNNNEEHSEILLDENCSVHVVQNLVFYLTGKNLTIQLPELKEVEENE